MTGSPFPIRGALEAFYGTYYTFPERNDLIRFLGENGFNFFLYGPKNDRQHRVRWWEPYPGEVLDQFAATIELAQACGVTFCYAISFGSPLNYSSAEDFHVVIEKLQGFFDRGCRAFSVLFDDFAPGWETDPGYRGFSSPGQAHADYCNRLLDWARSLDAQCTLCACPTHYAGRAPFGAYLEDLGRALQPDVPLFYTGPDICSHEINRHDAREFASITGRKPLIWDNYPVNDLAMRSQMHIGPLRGRDPMLAAESAGYLANLMNEAEASKIALLTIAEYLANPATYDPDAAWERALRRLGEREYTALKRVSENSLRSCLDRTEAPTLERLVAEARAALERGPESVPPEVNALSDYLDALDDACYRIKNRMSNLALRQNLLPWVADLESKAWLGRRALNVARARIEGQASTAELRQLVECIGEVERATKQIGGAGLLELARSVRGAMRIEKPVRSGSIAATPANGTSARHQAEQVLLANAGELGLLGARSAYQQVWARDSMICGLGLLCCSDPALRAVHQRSLSTLRRFQSPLGKIPHNVGLTGIPDPALVAHGGALEPQHGQDSYVSDTIHAGCVDGNLWYIIGQYYSQSVRADTALLAETWESLERALLWLRYQDSNECGLLEVHEAMDWADLFANRYNVLYDNVLYFAVWKCMAVMATALGLPSEFYASGAADVHRKINALLWVGPEEPRDWDWVGVERREWLYALRRIGTELVERPFYLPYVAFRGYGDRFDTLGNLLAILFGVADDTKTAKILDYIEQCGLDQPFPVRALYPTIRPGEADWRDYYRVRNLNLPDQYHNGGAWPFIGGFYVAALVRARRLTKAQEQFDRLTAMNRLGKDSEWGFNEWFHGISGRPMGYDRQSWSAAMYLFAAECIEHGKVPIFNRETIWSADA